MSQSRDRRTLLETAGSTSEALKSDNHVEALVLG